MMANNKALKEAVINAVHLSHLQAGDYKNEGISVEAW